MPRRTRDIRKWHMYKHVATTSLLPLLSKKIKALQDPKDLDRWITTNLSYEPKMSQHIQHHHAQYVHYNPNPHPQQQLPVTHVAPKDTQHKLPEQASQPIIQQKQQRSQQVASQSAQASGSGSTPVVAKGDWTKDLVHLAKTAELKYVPCSLNVR